MRNSYFSNRKKIGNEIIAFEDRPKAAREYAGFSQDDLASKAYEHDEKLSLALIQAIEQKKRPLSNRAAKVISDLCGVRYEWLTDPDDEYMTENEIIRYNEMRDLENGFSEYNERVKVALSDGYHFLVWIALQRLRNEYEILPVEEGIYHISKGTHSITIKETEIKEDLFDYAEFRLRKLIKSRLSEDNISFSQAEKSINSFFQMNEEVK